MNSENLEEASQGEKVNNVVEVNNAPEAIEDVPNNVDEDEIEIAVDKSFEGEEDINDIQFVKGRPGAQTLGKLVVGQKQQFVCNRKVKYEGGSTYYYDCARKHEGKGKGPGASSKAKAIVTTNDVGEDTKVVKMPKLTDHNHVCDAGRVVKWLLYEELDKEFLQNIMAKPSEVRKKVCCHFKEKYSDQPEVWNQVVALLPADHHIDRFFLMI